MSTRARSLCCQQQLLRRLAEMDRVGGSALPTELGPPQWLLIIPGGGAGQSALPPTAAQKRTSPEVQVVPNNGHSRFFQLSFEKKTGAHPSHALPSGPGRQIFSTDPGGF